MRIRKSLLLIIPLSAALGACSNVNLRLPAPLSRCDAPLGTVSLTGPSTSLQRYNLPNPAPMLMKIIGQSKCFTVTGGAGPGRDGARAPDWVVTPGLVIENFSAEAASNLENVPLLGGLVNRTRGMFGGEAAAFLEAEASLNAAGRTGKPSATTQGSAKRSSLTLFRLDPEFIAAGGPYAETEVGKIAVFAFIQAHNRLVKTLRPAPAAR